VGLIAEMGNPLPLLDRCVIAIQDVEMGTVNAGKWTCVADGDIRAAKAG